MYTALLVELGFFDKVTVGFLIIGHTHASIDQYFSCLRKLIRRASFIASPLALHHLFSLDKSVSESTKSKLRSVYRPPLRQIQLLFVHDYKSAFAPYINKTIANFQIPYQFQFVMFAGKCICQYKQFSTSLEWLPIVPSLKLTDVRDYDEIFNQRVYNFEDNVHLSSVVGLNAFQEFIGLGNNVTSSELVANKNIAPTAIALQNTLPILNAIEQDAIHEQGQRHAYEQEGICDIPRFSAADNCATADGVDYRNTVVSLQKSMESINTKQKGSLLLCNTNFKINNYDFYVIGFLIWIDYLASSPAPPSIASIAPVPINPKTIWEEKKHRGGQEALEVAEEKAEKAAIAYYDESTRNDSRNKGRGDTEEGSCSDTDVSEIVGELSRALNVSKAERRKLKRQEKKASSSIARTDLQFVISALSNMKAAANFMLNKKIHTGAIQVSNKSFQELTYDKIFQRKVVTPEDVKFYEERTTVDSILQIVDDAIHSAAKFEWLPTNILSAEQILEREKALAQQSNQAEVMRRLCDQLLQRERERMQGETVERLTNEAQVRNEQRQLARREKEAQREHEKEQKALEREQKKVAEKQRKAIEKEQRAVQKRGQQRCEAESNYHYYYYYYIYITFVGVLLL